MPSKPERGFRESSYRAAMPLRARRALQTRRNFATARKLYRQWSDFRRGMEIASTSMLFKEAMRKRERDLADAIHRNMLDRILLDGVPWGRM